VNPIGLPMTTGGGFVSGTGIIGGALPWGGGGNPVGARSAGQVANAYQQAYNSALAMNQANYNNILAGYQQAVAAQTTAQQAIQAGYSDLYNQVLTKVDTIGEGARMTIDRNFAQNLARTSQQLIDRGLGNTTVQSSVNQGFEGERAFQQTQLADQMATRSAEYMSRLGLSALGNRQQHLSDSTGLALRQLDWMNSVQARYPDPGMYAALAQGLGEQERGGGGFGGGSFAGRPGPKLGYVPSYGRFQAPAYTGPAPGGGGYNWLAAQYGAGGGGGGGWNTPDPAWALADGGFDFGAAGGAVASGALSAGEFDFGGAAGAVAGGLSDAGQFADFDEVDWGWN